MSLDDVEAGENPFPQLPRENALEEVEEEEEPGAGIDYRRLLKGYKAFRESD